MGEEGARGASLQESAVVALQSQLVSSTEQLGGCETRPPDLWHLSALETFLTSRYHGFAQGHCCDKAPKAKCCTRETQATEWTPRELCQVGTVRWYIQLAWS